MSERSALLPYRTPLLGLWVSVSAVLYLLLLYGTERHQTGALLGLYFGLFLLSLLAFAYTDRSRDVKVLLVVAIAFRLLPFGTMPTLSDDVYRFLWDGYLLNDGLNPFVQVPSEYILEGQQIPGITPQLYQKLNSPDYHTIYPPLCQGLFWLAVKISPNSWLGAATVLRLILLLGELGTLFLLYKLSRRYRQPRNQVLLYALNPLAILEITGNLHFEGLVIFFVLTAVYVLKKRQRILSAVCFTLAIITKLLPLIFLPLFFKRLPLRQVVGYYTLVALLVFLSFTPFLNRDFLLGLTDSLTLYFQKFEFNASIYYLVRGVGYWIHGHNIIAVAGKALALLSAGGMLLYAAVESPRSSKLPRSFVWILSIYLLFSTTVHPWYILPLLAYGTLTQLRFPVVWSALVFLSYAGYTATGYQENLWLVALEYLAVGTVVYLEIRHKTKKPPKNNTSYLVVSDTATLNKL